jgi:tetratricopeptide (TPR) repeat protein
LRGGTLAHRLKTTGKMPVHEARRLALRLLDTLEQLHAEQVLHRDIKPSNILFDDDGVAYLADLGVAHAPDQTLTGTGAIVGTPAFMAPEQFRGLVVDQRADIYSLGASLFEAVTGKRLHGGGGVRDARQLMVATTGDEAFADAVARAIADEPLERFPDARSFAAALGQPLALAKKQKRLARAAAVSVLVVVLVVVVGALAWRATHPALRGPYTLAPVQWAGVTDDTRAAVLAVIEERLRASGATVAAASGPLVDGTRLELSIDLEGDDARVRLRATTASRPGAPRVLLDEKTPRPRVATLLVERAPAILGTLGVNTAASSRNAAWIDAKAEAAVMINEGRWEAALEALQRAEVARPSDGDIAYRQAVTSWWASMPDDIVSRHMERALKLATDEKRRTFLEGLSLLSRREPAQATRVFEGALARWPGDRNLLYGEFEALYHDARPDDAMKVYRALVDAFPGFRLGQYHVVTRARALGDEAFARWALHAVARDGATDEDVLAASRLLGSGRPSEAVALLRAADCARQADTFRAAAKDEPLTGASTGTPLAVADAVAGRPIVEPRHPEVARVKEAIDLEKAGRFAEAAASWAAAAAIDDARPHAIVRFREARAPRRSRRRRRGARVRGRPLPEAAVAGVGHVRGAVPRVDRRGATRARPSRRREGGRRTASKDVPPRARRGRAPHGRAARARRALTGSTSATAT